MTNILIGATKKKRRGSSSKSIFFSKLSFNIPHFGSISLGILAGVILTTVLFSLLSPSSITLKIPQLNSKPVNAGLENTAKAESLQPATPKEPRFEFYTELTKSSNAPDQEIVAKPPVFDLKSAAKPINSYLVQAGAFRKRSEADALKATLTLNGFDAKLEVSKQDNGEQWHRVFIGPFKTEAKANEHKQILSTLAIPDALVLKSTN